MLKWPSKVEMGSTYQDATIAGSLDRLLRMPPLFISILSTSILFGHLNFCLMESTPLRVKTVSIWPDVVDVLLKAILILLLFMLILLQSLWLNGKWSMPIFQDLETQPFKLIMECIYIHVHGLVLVGMLSALTI